MNLNHSSADISTNSRSKPWLQPFVYTWFHSSTGNRGIGTIFVLSYFDLVEWLNRWNRSGAKYGWEYSIFDTSG